MSDFRHIERTKHYIEEHEKYFPLNEVIKAIYESPKNRRRKGDKIEIENERYYILGVVENHIFYVINAKWKR